MARRLSGERLGSRLVAAGLVAVVLAGILAVLPEVALAAGSPAGADPAHPLTFPRLDIQVMPEYDTDYPEALVIVQGSLKNGGSEPFTGQVTFWVPQGARMNSACELSGDPFTTQNPVHDNQLARGRVKIENQGDHQEISWVPTKPVKPGEALPVHMEFYYPAVRGGPEKQLDFTYMAKYAAERVTLEVAQPARSTGYSASLQEVGGGQAGDGTYMHGYEVPGVKAGDPVQVQVRYTKPDNNKSVSNQGAPAKPPLSGGSLKGNQAILAIAAVMVLALGFLLFFGGSKARRPASARRGKPDPRGEDERSRARRLLLEGKISEGTYREIIRDLKGKER